MEPLVISERDILDVLKAIEDGQVNVTLENDASELAGGYPVFKTNNGWRFRVCSEQGTWHHIEEVWAPSGAHLNPWDDRWMSEYRAVREYDAPRKIVYPVFRLKPSNATPSEGARQEPA